MVPVGRFRAFFDRPTTDPPTGFFRIDRYGKFTEILVYKSGWMLSGWHLAKNYKIRSVGRSVGDAIHDLEDRPLLTHGSLKWRSVMFFKTNRMMPVAQNENR